MYLYDIISLVIYICYVLRKLLMPDNREEQVLCDEISTIISGIETEEYEITMKPKEYQPIKTR